SYCGQPVENTASGSIQYGQTQNVTPNAYVPNANQAEEDKVSVGLVIVSVLIPLVGIIVGIVNMSKGKKKSGKVYLIVAIAVWAASFLLQILAGGMLAFMPDTASLI
ncbi:hypothetical protein, partial [Ruminococcus flavefaciens]|uniref:hypothetical protein n=1 Tax=Ruminococcus flavefaciens TaxID=1265 RepID=UPI0026EAA246